MTTDKLTKPIGVFDAGIGSYDIARRISQDHPSQDIIYFGDRASFPYGNKSHEDLRACISSAIQFFLRFNPGAIVLASNAPSIMVLDTLKNEFQVPIIGVTPPIDRAMSLSANSEIGILGVDSLINSPELSAYIDQQTTDTDKVHLIAASDLVELVENGMFLSEPEKTAEIVGLKMSAVPSNIDVFTLSSTHLPWLRSYFESACPEKTFIDPADDVVELVRPHITEGAGMLKIVASESSEHSIEGFQSMLSMLGVEAPVFSQRSIEQMMD